MILSILMFFISLLASFPVAILGTLYFINEEKIFFSLIIGIIISFLIIIILRSIFKIHRPNIRGLKTGLFSVIFSSGKLFKLRRYLHELEKRSFASAHIARISVFISVLYLFEYNIMWIFALIFLMIIVGFARLYLKRHRFIDLIVGCVVGLFSGYAGIYIVNLFLF